MTWAEMKRTYPDEWLLITDYVRDEFGHLSEGFVERHSKKKKEVFYPPIVDRDTAYRYTGESTFAGFRSHAARHYNV